MIGLSRATVCISAHYVPARVQFLETVLTAIATWPVEKVHGVIVTNSIDLMEQASILALKETYATKGWELRGELSGPLNHPFELTWVHKNLLQDWLSAGVKNDDLFFYLEDDIVLTRRNLDYFIHYLQLLRIHRLIPSFLRYETVNLGARSVDFTEPQVVRGSRIRLAGYEFIGPSNPYWAGYILDKSLAEEYVKSDSFDLNRSRLRSSWEVRERAAMGLTWEHPPKGFESRYVVPLVDARPAEECLVWHCAQTYTSAGHPKFGRLPVEEMFIKDNPALYARRAVRRAVRGLRSVASNVLA
jgi:hypothetical protein